MKRKGSSSGVVEPLDLTAVHQLLRAPLALAHDDPRRLPAIQEALQRLTPAQFYLLEKKVAVDDLIRDYKCTYHQYDAGSTSEGTVVTDPPSPTSLTSLQASPAASHTP